MQFLLWSKNPDWKNKIPKNKNKKGKELFKKIRTKYITSIKISKNLKSTNKYQNPKTLYLEEEKNRFFFKCFFLLRREWKKKKKKLLSS